MSESKKSMNPLALVLLLSGAFFPDFFDSLRGFSDPQVKIVLRPQHSPALSNSGLIVNST